MPSVQGSCLCGGVKLSAVRKPRTLTQCNCSVCRRYGTLWAYYTRGTATVTAPRGALVRYRVKPGGLYFVHCKTCGCVTQWESPRKTPDARFALNGRLLEADAIARVPIKMLDGDKTWRVLERSAQPNVFRSPHRT